MTITDITPRPLFSVIDMAALHATLHADMYVPSGMPDAAMNALFDAHAAVVKELTLTPSSDPRDVAAKESAIAVIKSQDADDSPWAREIKGLEQSIAADHARLNGSTFLLAAE